MAWFTSYENQDWFIPTLAVKPKDGDIFALMPDVVCETTIF